MISNNRFSSYFLIWGFILLNINNLSFGQEYFKGSVKDQETGDGIISATIFYGQGKGVISDTDGKFVIENPVFPLIIEVSHLNYKAKSMIIRSMDESGLVIQLQSSQVEIDQVEILGERITRLFKNKYYYIVDYAFLNDNILMIGFDQNQLVRGQLLLTDQFQDTLSVKPIRKPKELIQDAFGNIHLYAGDSVYQVILINDTLDLIYPCHRDAFIDVLKLQIAEEHSFIVKEIFGDGQLHVYSRIDTLTKEKRILKEVFDYRLFSDSRRASSFKDRKLQQLDLDYQGPMGELAAEVLSARSMFQATAYYNLITHQPITSQIFRCGNEYVILDIPNSEIDAFTVDSLKERNVNMDIPNHKIRSKSFIQDDFTQKIYWVYYQGSKALLGELDINTGKVVNQIETPSLPFIENIKIRNGEIWFLYQARLGETVRSLYHIN